MKRSGVRAGSPARGFTLVEMMVAMAVGLVLALVISVSVLTMGLQFRKIGAGAAAEVNAQVALSMLDEAGRSAGAGLFNNAQRLCATLNARRADGTVAANGAALMPLRIIDGGGAGASDTVVFTALGAAGAMSGTPVLVNMLTGADSIVVNDATLLSDGDLALVGVPGNDAVPCTLFQVTAAPVATPNCAGNATQCRTLLRATTSNHNAPPATFAQEPRYGFTPGGGVAAPAVVHRVGTAFRQEAFGVQCQTLVQYDAFAGSVACTQSPLGFGAGVNALVTETVLMHAQYGISVTANSDVVSDWVDATGAWANPNPADVGRIKALRVVIVTRAREPDGEAVTAASCTNAANVVNTGPCSFIDAQAPVIDLSGVAVPAGRTWRHFRYRVHQAVIPLRNVIWAL